MTNGSKLSESRELIGNVMSILSDKGIFKKVELSMPDMIDCYLNGSIYFPYAIEHNTPIIHCIIRAYFDKLVFVIPYFKGKNCKYIENRLINELPYLKTPNDIGISKLSFLSMLKILDEQDMKYLKSIGNYALKEKILKDKINMFFECYANKIISKIIEIQLGVRI